MPELTVELYGQEVGRLVGSDWRRFDFESAGAAIERFGLDSTLLSTSVPLVPFGNRSHLPPRASGDHRRAGRAGRLRTSPPSRNLEPDVAFI